MKSEEPQRIARNFFHLRSFGKLAKSKAVEANKSSPDISGANLKSHHCLRRNPTLKNDSGSLIKLDEENIQSKKKKKLRVTQT